MRARGRADFISTRRLAPWQVYLFSTASSRLRDCDEQCRCVVAARMASSTPAFFVEGRGGSFPNMRATRFTSSRPPVHISPSPPLRPRIDQATLLALPLLPSCFSLPCFPHFTHQLTTALPSLPFSSSPASVSYKLTLFLLFLLLFFLRFLLFSASVSQDEIRAASCPLPAARLAPANGLPLWGDT